MTFSGKSVLGRIAVIGGAMLLLAGCASSQKPYTLDPVKTFDPDNRPIEDPEETQENQYWDRIDLTAIYQLEKPLDLNWTGRQIGRLLGTAGKKEADNINALGEPPSSSWYTRRHYYHEMTLEELARGPNTTGGPDQTRPWTIVSGKLEGASSGFVIEDRRGDRYVIKFDGRNYPELASSAEVVSTKILYAAGYYVPQNYVAYVDPARLVIGEGAEVREEGVERPMRPADLERILQGHPRTAEGKIRVLASKYVDGRPYGPWQFRGTREDDPNDQVWHQHRRELRGLRVIGAWLNDADRRAANTLAVYTDEKYLKHYLIDMGSTLGANGGRPHDPIHGQAYLFDPRYIALSAVALGLYERPWAGLDPAPRYRSVGYFRSDVFRPGRWVPTYPNPAFEKMTFRDAFWGAKIVMSFTDEDLAAIVETGRLTNPEAEAYLLRILKERRDETGRYWFQRVAPVDRFRVTDGSDLRVASRRSAGGASRRFLRFEDLAVRGGLAEAAATRYTAEIYHEGRRLRAFQELEDPAVPLMAGDGQPLKQIVKAASPEADTERIVKVRLITRREGQAPLPATDVYLYYPPGAASPRVAGIERQTR